MATTTMLIVMIVALVAPRLLAAAEGSGAGERPAETKRKVRDIAAEIMKQTITPEEAKELTSKKDCTGYRPPKRIQCDISLYLAELLTAVEAQNDINLAVIEWRKEGGDLEQLAFLSFNLRTFGIGIGVAEALTTTWYYEIPFTLPRYMTKSYVTHASKYEKPTLVYAISEHTGYEVIDHWHAWTALEGKQGNNILYVQDTKNHATNEKKSDCKNFLDLPKSLRERKHVSVVMKTLSKCSSITDDYEQVIGEYKSITIRGLHESQRLVPKWECDIKTGTCFGDVPVEHEAMIDHFLS